MGFKLNFYWIFVAHFPKGRMGFIFVDFCQRWVFEVSALICVSPNFLGFSWHGVDHGYRLSVGCNISIQPLLHFYVTLGCMPHVYSRSCI